MLAARCPSCGRPGPLRLDQPDRMTCSCGYDGPPPPEVVPQLRAAARVLDGQGAQYRQLSTLQRRVLSSGLFASALYAATLALAMLPFGCCFGCLIADEGPLNFALVVMFGTPLLVVGVFGASGLLFLRSRLGRARDALRAFPPTAAGEPARCHVCGGPVTPEEDRAFARCGYCGADNVIDAGTVLALDARRDLVLDGYEAAVGQRALAGRQAFRSAVRGVLASVVVALPVAFCAGFVVSIPLRQLETDVYDELEYAVVTDEGGERCLVDVRERSGETLDLGAVGTRPRSEVTTFGAAAIREGLGVRTRLNTQHGDAWRVLRVFGTAGTAENLVVIRADEDGFERNAAVGELCLLDGEPSPAPPVDARPAP